MWIVYKACCVARDSHQRLNMAPDAAMVLSIVFISSLLCVETFPVEPNSIAAVSLDDPQHPSGVWRSKTVWKARWIKEWKVEKVLKSFWKKIWGPVEIKEWIPIPKPPPPDWQNQEEQGRRRVLSRTM